MEGTTYRNGAPGTYDDRGIRAKKTDLSQKAAALFWDDGWDDSCESGDHCVQALKNANNLTQRATNSTELYTLVCASGKASIFVSDTTADLVFLAKSRKQAGLGTALIEKLIVECRRTFWSDSGRGVKQICVALQACLRGRIGFYEAAGFVVHSSAPGGATSCDVRPLWRLV